MFKTLKNNWTFVVIGSISLVLGVLALYTAMRLRELGPVAPTVPQAQPQAVDGTPVANCRLTFGIGVASSPSPTPTATPVGGTPICGSTCTTATQSTACPGGMVCYVLAGQVSGVCRNPSCLTAANCVCRCGDTCTNSSQCPSAMQCYIEAGQTSGVCRVSACLTESDCTCNASPAPSSSPQPSATPTVPRTGSTWPTTFLMIGGAALLIIGLGFTL